MALGQRRTERQQEMWVATAKLPASIGHVFYDALNDVLRDGQFDHFAESLCERFYEEGGRPGIPPGIYFRMIFGKRASKCMLTGDLFFWFFQGRDHAAALFGRAVVGVDRAAGCFRCDDCRLL